jgi:manganese/zinc/iron transport system substrate-binding protein
MYFFKKIIFILAASLTATGCSGKGSGVKDWMKGSAKPRILSTTAQVGDLVSEIGGERIATWVLIQGDLDPHSYELVKGDDEKFFRADCIFYNGLGLEHGASLSSILRSSDKAVPIGEKIAAAQPDRILKKGEVVDPHIWMDISLWKGAIDPIVENLSAVDPEGASYYQTRGIALAAKMDQTHEEVLELLHRVPASKRYLITSHDAFRYFARSYLSEPGESDWAKRFTAPEGLAPDGQLNPYDIQRIIDFLREKKVSVLFPESNVSRDSIRKIASAGKELGLEIRVCSEPLYGDSTSGLSYLEMMRKNGDVISRYLP